MSAARCVGLSTTTDAFTVQEMNVLSRIILNKQNAATRYKDNDFSLTKIREHRWMAITEEFNAQPCANKRSVKQLKKCWENIKMTATRQQIDNINNDVMGADVQVIGSDAEDIKPIIVSEIRSLHPDQHIDGDTHSSADLFSNGITVDSPLICIDSLPVHSFDSHHNDSDNEDVTSHVSHTEDKLLSYEEEERALRIELLRNRINQENELHRLKMQQVQEQHQANMKIQIEKHELYMKHQKELLQIELKHKCASKFPL